jgi:hypothetical protein
MGTEASFNFADVNPTQANPGTEPPTPGDRFVISETITKHGEAFGSLYIQCTFVVADVTQCIATFDLPSGQITVQGVLRDVPDFTVAVTGATGDYSGAGGTLAVHDPTEDASLRRTTSSSARPNGVRPTASRRPHGLSRRRSCRTPT